MNGHTEQPFFNLVVPTKDRANTLYWTLRCLLLQDYPHYQIVVSDNCSSDTTAQVVADLGSDKIVYYRTPERLSMAANYEFALSKLDRGYVMVIGDDDGLVPTALQTLAQVIRAQQPEVLIGKRLIYNWGSYPYPHLANMLLEPRSNDYYYWLQSDKMLELAADWMYIFNFGNHGGVTLPSIYHGGCVSVAVIDRIRRRDGRFLNCQFPDYYSAIILTAEVARYLFLETPYFITGSSGNSTGVSAFLNQQDKKSEFQQFQKDNTIPLESPLVFCHSFALFTAEAILKAQHFNPKVKLFDWKNLLYKMVDDGLWKPTRAQYDDVAAKVLELGKVLRLEDHARSLLQRLPYKERLLERAPEGLDKHQTTFAHHAERQGIEHIEQAARYTIGLTKDRHPVFLADTTAYFKKQRSRNFWQRAWAKIKRILTGK